MKKLLVVEDEQFLLNAYQLKFAKAGFEVKTAMDGNEAIQALRTFIPDLILLDLLLPKKDGFTFLEEIKRVKEWKHIPVIVVSNLSQEEDIQKGLQLGAVDFVVKPDITLNDIIDKINSTLNTS